MNKQSFFIFNNHYSIFKKLNSKQKSRNKLPLQNIYHKHLVLNIYFYNRSLIGKANTKKIGSYAILEIMKITY